MANVDFLPNVKTSTGFDALNTVSTYINHTARTVTTNGDTYEINVPAPNDILTGQFVLIFVPDTDSIVGMKISINNGAAIPIDGVGAGSLQNGVATSLLVDVGAGVTYSVDSELATKATTVTYTGTLASASWTGSSAPYSQTITVTGMTSTDEPICDLTLSGTYETDVTLETEWAKVFDLDTGTNQVTLKAHAIPTVDLPFRMKVVR